ncbi:hypothetical protein F2P81_018703 [Scophthalmus maximus]|uniref:Uncharacterized protein n=1 Tax=Scophthalmus maximus TaxID=52904 RepID=A0A6A4SBC7_SCOMX|nr:hypothetical protein F2P81_018703 [Scophthalmus maximus]
MIFFVLLAILCRARICKFALRAPSVADNLYVDKQRALYPLLISVQHKHYPYMNKSMKCAYLFKHDTATSTWPT